MKLKPLIWLGLGVCLMGLACNLPVAAAQVTPTAANTSLPTASATPFAVGSTLTPEPMTGTSAECSYQWTSNPEPDLSAVLQDMFDQAGITNLKVDAEAYGENCTWEDGTQGEFALMETDVKFVLDVDSLQDQDALAVQAHEILRIMYGIPQDQFPGPNPGYIGITFQTPDQKTQYYWFPKQVGIDAFMQGLTGEDLLKALNQS